MNQDIKQANLEKPESSMVGEDELIRLVTSNADVTSQYVLFRNGYDELYAINVSKVEELIVNRDLNIARSSDGHHALIGVAKIRDHMCSIVHFDKWLGKGEKPGCNYELILVCNYGHQTLGIVIKNVIGIMNIEANQLEDNYARDQKTAQITELYIAGTKRLCIVFNSDALLEDIFPQAVEKEYDKMNFITNANINKKLLFADDSKIVQKAVCMVLEKMDIDFEVFDNGQLLLERLYTMDPSDIGLILSDIEMPVKDGMALLREVKANPKYKDIHFVMNTNMANTAIIEQAKTQGADYVVRKLDVEDLEKQVLRYAGR